MNKEKNKSKKKRTGRTAANSTPDATATVKTNNTPTAKLDAKLGSASASVIRTQPKVFSPVYLDSNLNFPRDIRTQNQWNRNYFVTNPIVGNAIRMHASYTCGKFQLKCKDPKVKAFFEDMLSKMNFEQTLLEIGLEFWKLGEVFPYAELNEEQGIWDYIIVHNPDFIHVPPPSPIQKEPMITLVPDEALKRLITSTNPRDRHIRKDIPSDVLKHLQNGEDIPLDNFNVSHLKQLSSPYDTRGTSLVTMCYRDLMLYDKIREAKIVQADNFMNPLTLVKLGNEQWQPTDDDIRQWQEQVVDAQGDAGYTIVSHGLVDIAKISNAGQTLDMGPDLEMCIKNICHAMQVPPSLYDTEYGSYANSSVSLEVMKDRYKAFQLQLKRWIEKKILEPISKIQDFYYIEGGEEKLIVPEVEFDKVNLKETDTYITAAAAHIGDPAQPGGGKISMRTFHDLMDTDYDIEKANLRMEDRDNIVRAKELAAMQNMDIHELKTLTSTTPIQDTREIESLEKALNLESGDGGGGMGGGDMGGGDMGGDDMGGDDMGDMGDMGDDMGGEDMGGEAPADAPV